MSSQHAHSFKIFTKHQQQHLTQTQQHRSIPNYLTLVSLITLTACGTISVICNSFPRPRAPFRSRLAHLTLFNVAEILRIPSGSHRRERWRGAAMSDDDIIPLMSQSHRSKQKKKKSLLLFLMDFKRSCVVFDTTGHVAAPPKVCSSAPPHQCNMQVRRALQSRSQGGPCLHSPALRWQHLVAVQKKLITAGDSRLWPTRKFKMSARD